MYRYLLCFCLVILPAAASSACEGQKGSVLFEDKFTDTSGGWMEFGDNGQIKDNKLTLIPALSAQDKVNALTFSVLTFTANEGDYCTDIVLPDTDLGADNYITAGVVFLRKDDDNKFLFQISTQGNAILAKKSAGTWTNIYSKQTPAIDLHKGAINSVRVIVKNNVIKTLVNNSEINTTRAQIPRGDFTFGVYDQIIKPIDGKPSVEFRSYKVTSGE